jgi:MSHA pilin protein MshC
MIAMKHTQYGLTIIELVTVIVIMATLAAVVGPRFFGEQPYSELGYADELAAALRSAQKVAVGSGCWVAVDVDPAGYRANQRADAADCMSNGPWTTPVMGIDGTPVAGITANGVAVVGSSQFVFNGAGTLEGTPADVQVGRYTLSVLPSTGMVAIN